MDTLRQPIGLAVFLLSLALAFSEIWFQFSRLRIADFEQDGQ
jgi:hypothetical protein